MKALSTPFNNLFKWDVVCHEKIQGGLGLRNLVDLNKALLGKWISGDLLSKPNCAWKRVIVLKYGLEDRGWRSRLPRGFWKVIMKEADWVDNNGEFVLGNGRRVRFWQDHWCGNSSLRLAFPAILYIARDKNATMVGIWDLLRAGGSWNIQFLRSFIDWEVDSVVSLLNFIQNFVVLAEEDKVRWKRVGGRGSL